MNIHSSINICSLNKSEADVTRKCNVSVCFFYAICCFAWNWKSNYEMNIRLRIWHWNTYQIKHDALKFTNNLCKCNQNAFKRGYVPETKIYEYLATKFVFLQIFVKLTWNYTFKCVCVRFLFEKKPNTNSYWNKWVLFIFAYLLNWCNNSFEQNIWGVNFLYYLATHNRVINT